MNILGFQTNKKIKTKKSESEILSSRKKQKRKEQKTLEKNKKQEIRETHNSPAKNHVKRKHPKK